jgi:hypothetical protein
VQSTVKIKNLSTNSRALLLRLHARYHQKVRPRFTCRPKCEVYLSTRITDRKINPGLANWKYLHVSEALARPIRRLHRSLTLSWSQILVWRLTLEKAASQWKVLSKLGGHLLTLITRIRCHSGKFASKTRFRSPDPGPSTSSRLSHLRARSPSMSPRKKSSTAINQLTCITQPSRVTSGSVASIADSRLRSLSNRAN